MMLWLIMMALFAPASQPSSRPVATRPSDLQDEPLAVDVKKRLEIQLAEIRRSRMPGIETEESGLRESISHVKRTYDDTSDAITKEMHDKEASKHPTDGWARKGRERREAAKAEMSKSMTPLQKRLNELLLIESIYIDSQQAAVLVAAGQSKRAWTLWAKSRASLQRFPTSQYNDGSGYIGKAKTEFAKVPILLQ